MDEPFNACATIRKLKTSKLIIRTIPGEEWTLSCHRHKTLLVDVYVLEGWIAGARCPQRWECGRLCELLIRLLRTGRKAGYASHLPTDERVQSLAAKTKMALADTLEEDARMRLRSGDIVFHATGVAWRLTGTSFGILPHGVGEIFYLAEESTIGTRELNMLKGSLESVLLEFLCRNAVLVGDDAPKVLTFNREGEHAYHHRP